MPPLTDAPAWPALQAHAAAGLPHLRDLLADPGRLDRLVLEVGDMRVDATRHLVDDRALALLLELAEQRGVLDRLRATQAGAHVNTTEDRPALHTALRLPRDASLVVDGTDVVPLVHRELDRTLALAERIRSGDWRGATGQTWNWRIPTLPK